MKTVLCIANAYNEKYYLNPAFEALPRQIRDELQIISVMYTEEVGGILTISFDDEGKLLLETSALDSDFYYDEIGAQLLIKKLLQLRTDFFASLELYYKIFIQGESPDELLKEADHA